MPYISHSVIAKCKKYTEYGPDRKVRSCTILHAFEKENGIALSLVEWCNNTYFPIFSFKLSYKNDKFNFYRTSVKGNKGVKISSPSYLFQRLSHKVKKAKITGLAKAQKQRLYSVIKEFCKKKNVNIKYLSKDPETLIYQLCYPALVYLGKEIKHVETGQCGKFAKTNLVKSVLGTNGSLSKRLLTEAIQKYPNRYQEIVLIGRIIKQLFGLDKFQELIKEVDLLRFKSLKAGYRERLTLTQTIKRYKTFFNLFTFNKVKKLFSVDVTDNSIWPDTVDFTTQPNIIIPEEFDNILDLHDKLAVQLNRRKKAAELLKKSAAIPVPPEFRTLFDNWKSKEFDLVLPKDGMDLINWSEQMRNCVSTYENSLRNGRYYIIGIKRGGELKYNIGFSLSENVKTVTNTSNINISDTTCFKQVKSTIIKFSQWSCKGNSKIPEDEQIALINAFRMSEDKIANILSMELVNKANNEGRLLPLDFNNPF